MADEYDDLIRAEPSVLHYYSGNVLTGTGQLQDDEGTNHLTFSGGVTLHKPTILPGLETGEAVGFATDGHGTKSSASSLPAAVDGITIEAWVRPDSNVGTQIIFGTQTVYVECFNGSYYLIVKTTAATYSCGPMPFTPGEVAHVVGTWDGAANAQLYVNSVPSEVKTIESPAGTTPTFVTMGGWWNATSPLTGDVERAAIYLGALGATAIAEHYAVGSGSAPPPPPPPDTAGEEDEYDVVIGREPDVVSYYPGDAHAGATLTDVIGPNDLDLSGGFQLDQDPLLPAVATGKSAAFAVDGHATKTAAGGATGLPGVDDGITVEAWVRPAANVGTTIVFGTDIAYLQTFGDKWYFIVKTTGATYSVGRIAFVVGRTYHLVGAWDGEGNAQLYVNGIPKSGVTIVESPHAAATFVTMGAWWNGTAGSTCRVERGAVYRGMLSTAKVREHYKAGLPKGPTAAPVSRRLPQRLTLKGQNRPKLPPVLPASGYGGFVAGNWPDARWRPYGPLSPWNLPADGAAVHPRSSEIVTNLLALYGTPAKISVGQSTMGNSDFMHPVYFAQETDPLYTISLHSAYDIAPGEQLRMPVLAQPAKSSDGHICVIQPNGWAYEIWQAAVVGSSLTGSIGKKVRIDGTGLSSAATAAHFALLAGAIRAEEWIQGQINHALFIVVAQLSEAFDFGFGVTKDAEGSDYVYPAEAGDSTLPGADLPPMGARLRLNYTDAEITALDIPEYRKTVVRALARRGAYIGDTGGPGIGFQALSGATYTSFGVFDPLVDFAIANGIVPNEDGSCSFEIAPGVDWSRLQILVPPTP